MARESDGTTAGGVVAASDEKKVDEQVSQQDRLPESLGGLSGQEDEDAMGEGSLSLIYGVRGRERGVTVIRIGRREREAGESLAIL